MPFERSDKQTLFAPHSAYEMHDKDASPGQVYRWKIMGGIALALLGLVIYLYHIKVGEPVEQWEADIESQVVTQPELCENRLCNKAN